MTFKCPFCGKAGKATKEHVFGQRFKRAIPSVAAQIKRMGDYSDPVESRSVRPHSAGYQVVRTTSRGKRTPELQKVQVKVCAECNGGWMADLDRDALEIILRQSGHQILEPLTSEQGVVLEKWVCKLGLAYDLFVPDDTQAFTAGLRATYFATQSLPGYLLYVAHESNAEWFSFWQDGWQFPPFAMPKSEATPKGPNLSTTFISIGHMRLIGHRIDPTLHTEALSDIKYFVSAVMKDCGYTLLTNADSPTMVSEISSRAHPTAAIGALEQFVVGRSPFEVKMPHGRIPTYIVRQID